MDAKGLLKAAIRDDNPVIFIEHETLYGVRGEVPENGDGVVNFGEAAIRREGSDVTIVGILRMAEVALQAARILSEEHGVEAEVIDPRTLRPLDLDTILKSVQKTNRAVIVEEGWPHGGVGANLAALIQGQAFDYLDAPVERVTGADVHMPYSKRMEQAAIPHAENVVSAALQTLEGSRLAEIVMPRLSDSMEEGTVLRWLKGVGDEVAVGDELVEIETDKANMVYESDLAGTVVEIVAQEGDTLPVEDPIARVGDAGGVVSGNGGGAGAAVPSGQGRRRKPPMSIRPQISQPSNGGSPLGPRPAPTRRVPRRQRPHPLPQPVLAATGAGEGLSDR